MDVDELTIETQSKIEKKHIFNKCTDIFILIV